MFTALYRLETEILAGLLGSSCWLQWSLRGLSNSHGKWESLSDAVNNVWHRQGRSAVDNRWAETCACGAFWLCAGDYPCVLVIYKAPLFSSLHTVPQNVWAASFNSGGLSQLLNRWYKNEVTAQRSVLAPTFSKPELIHVYRLDSDSAWRAGHVQSDIYSRNSGETAEWSGQPLELTSALPCVTEGDQPVLGDDKGSKNSTHAAPLVSQVVACMFVCVWGGRVYVCKRGRGHLDRYNSFTPAPQYIYWGWGWHQFKVRPNLPRYPSFCIIQLFTTGDLSGQLNRFLLQTNKPSRVSAEPKTTSHPRDKMLLTALQLIRPYPDLQKPRSFALFVCFEGPINMRGHACTCGVGVTVCGQNIIHFFSWFVVVLSDELAFCHDRSFWWNTGCRAGLSSLNASLCIRLWCFLKLKAALVFLCGFAASLTFHS